MLCGRVSGRWSHALGPRASLSDAAPAALCRSPGEEEEGAEKVEKKEEVEEEEDEEGEVEEES